MNQANTQSGDGRLAVGVIGCGRMGRLHARVYSQIPQVHLVGVHDVNPESARKTAADYGCAAMEDLEAMLPEVSAVTIAVPTQYHTEVAEKCLQRGVACLIEKPLAKSLDEARKIVRASEQGRALVQVGHIERFNPALQAMRRLEVRPRFIEVVRISPMTFRSIDVGVVLDMMIHDIDIVLCLAGAKVKGIEAVGVSVIGQVEDICNARLTFENGCVANLTASRLAMKTERRMRLFSTDAYVSLDFQKRYGIVAHRGRNLAAIRQAVERIKSGEIQDLSQLNYADLVRIEELQIDDVEPLRSQLDSFVAAVRGQRAPEVSAAEGLRAVEVAMTIMEQIKSMSLG